MEELSHNEMKTIEGGILLEIALGLCFGAVCGAVAAKVADTVVSALK